MKKLIFTIFAAIVVSSFATSANAQMPAMSGVGGVGGFSNSSADLDAVVEHTLREEQEGREVWDKLQAKEFTCENLSDEQFGVLGEYFMGQMAGDSHAAMNAMMIQMHGEEGEEQIHIVMGKRISGCDTSAAFPAGSGGWTPMMNMMFPIRQGYGGQGGDMMNFGFGPFGFGGFGLIFMILWLVLIIAGIAALIKWMRGQSHNAHGHGKPFNSTQGKSALDVLKERYAMGEIRSEEH